MSIELFDKWGQRFNFKKHLTTTDEKPYVSGGMCEIRGRSHRPTLLNGSVIEFSGDGYQKEPDSLFYIKNAAKILATCSKLFRRKRVN